MTASSSPIPANTPAHAHAHACQIRARYLYIQVSDANDLLSVFAQRPKTRPMQSVPTPRASGLSEWTLWLESDTVTMVGNRHRTLSEGGTSTSTPAHDTVNGSAGSGFLGGRGECIATPNTGESPA